MVGKYVPVLRIQGTFNTESINMSEQLSQDTDFEFCFGSRSAAFLAWQQQHFAAVDGSLTDHQSLQGFPNFQGLEPPHLAQN